MVAFFVVLALIAVIALAYNATSDDKTRRSQTGHRAPDDVPIADTGPTIKVKSPAKSELASFTRKKKDKDSLDLYDKHSDILFAVKGLSYRDEQAQAAAKLCDKGDRLILKREPDNPADENAVQVYTMTGQMIGYVERQYAETVAELIDYINTCVVYKVTNHELPYIDALVKFSATPTTQPDFVTDPSEMTTRQRLQYDSVYAFSSGYREAYARIVNNRELPLRSREALLQMDGGTSIRLEKDDSNPSRPYAVKVYGDEVLLGWLDFDRAYIVYNHFDEVKAVKTTRMGRDMVSIMLPRSVDLLDIPLDLRSKMQVYDAMLWPETSEAFKMRSSAPERALEILLPIVKKEHDYRAASYCCTCYRALKQPDKELEMVNFILAKIEAYREDYEQREGKVRVEAEVAKWAKRRDVVKKMIK